MTKYYSKLKIGIAKALRQRLLRIPLWGVLDISQMERKYEIQEVIYDLMDIKYFKPDGFMIGLLDGNNFVQKLPYFDNNEEFIKKHDLVYLDQASYVTYMAKMYELREKYSKEE